MMTDFNNQNNKICISKIFCLRIRLKKRNSPFFSLMPGYVTVCLNNSTGIYHLYFFKGDERFPFDTIAVT